MSALSIQLYYLYSQWPWDGGDWLHIKSERLRCHCHWEQLDYIVFSFSCVFIWPFCWLISKQPVEIQDVCNTSDTGCWLAEPSCYVECCYQYCRLMHGDNQCVWRCVWVLCLCICAEELFSFPLQPVVWMVPIHQFKEQNNQEWHSITVC